MTDHSSESSSESSNMELWDKLRRVDPVHSKPFQRAGGFRGTAIKPSVQERLMTEVFGPIGFGWGMTKPEYHHITAGDEMLVYCTVGVWYRFNGEKSDVFWGEGGDKVSTVRKSGDISVDDEARKKSLTDAIGNALKRIGMAADIHMGLWDESKYRDENERFFAEKKKPDELRPAAIAKSEAELAQRLEAITDLDTLDELWKTGANARIKEIGTVDKAAQQRMISAFSEKKNEIIRKNEQGDAADPAVSDGENEDADPPENPAHQPSLQEMADRDQEEHTRQLEREEASAKPAHPAKTTQGDLTPEKIKLFEEWVSRKLTGVKDARELNALWDKDCAPRMLLIKDLDEDVHRRISAAYVKRMNELGGGFKRVSTQG